MAEKKAAQKTEIIVLGKPYEIRMTDDVGAGGALGQSMRSRQIIVLNTEECAKDQLEETLLHEVIHIVCGELRLDLSETMISCLAVGIYSAGYRQFAMEPSKEERIIKGLNEIVDGCILVFRGPANLPDTAEYISKARKELMA